MHLIERPWVRVIAPVHTVVNAVKLPDFRRRNRPNVQIVEYLSAAAIGNAQVLMLLGCRVGLVEVLGIGYKTRPQPIRRSL